MKKGYLIGLSLVMASFSSNAEEWRLGYGIHDYIVEDSNTLGVGVSFDFNHITTSNVQLDAGFNIYIDHDKDELDPDHIPVWFSSAFSARGELSHWQNNWQWNWLVELDGKRNTVSSIEKQVKLYPSLALAYEKAGIISSLKLSAGYYFMEIDDDVPKTRGYERGEFGHSSFAYAATVMFGGQLSTHWSSSLEFEYWHDGNDWLENKVIFLTSLSTPNLLEGSNLALSVEFSQYNLDHYAKVDTSSNNYLPILPWDSDTLVRVNWSLPW